MHLLLGILLCGGVGFVVVVIGCSSFGNPAARALQIFLSTGFGLGAFSLLFLCLCLLGTRNLIAIDVVALILLLVGWLMVRRRTGQAAMPAIADVGLPSSLRLPLVAGFALVLCAALYSAIRRAIALPNGEGWDAFAIWNLHARFLFRGGPAWRDGFSPLIPWSHPDYPLLLPAAIADFWTYLGHESHAVPSTIGLVFTISTAGVLFSALLLLRGFNAASLGSLALLATPAFVEQGTSQYADIPLSFFLLATVVLVCLHDALPKESPSRNGPVALAGLSCGFAAWTKNEGLLFLLALLIGYFLTGRASRDPGDKKLTTSWSAFLTAAVPLLFLIIWFKQVVAPPGDLFGNSATMLHGLLAGARYGAISRWFGKQFLLFGNWQWLPGTLLVGGAFLTLRNWSNSSQPQNQGLTSKDRSEAANGGIGTGFRACALALAIMLVGYFFIYIITPYDVYWHLRFSLNRLFLQLWPSALFLCFLRTGERLPDRTGAGGLKMSRK